MEVRSPLPLLEANLFLKNKTNGFTTEKFYQTIKTRYPKNEDEYSVCFELLLKLDAILCSAIEVNEEELNLLYRPLSLKEDSDTSVAQDSLSDIIFPDVNFFCSTDYSDTFSSLRELNTGIPMRIAASILPDEKLPCDLLSTADLIAIINGCDWPQSSKLTLIEFAINPEKYISLMERALVPVANAFDAHSDVWLPLIELFRSDYDTDETDGQKLHKRFGSVVPDAAEYMITPCITGFRQVLFSNASDKTCFVAVGVLYDTLARISTLESNSEAELSRIMSVLGDPSRFNIVTHLAKSESYGRELSKLLNITPGAVSQHLSILMSTGLIASSNKGNKVFYSLNNSKMQHFIKLLQLTFPAKD